MTLAKCSGIVPSRNTLSLANCSAIKGVLVALIKASAILPTISRGVPGVARSSFHGSSLKPGNVSLMVGTSGRSEKRFAPKVVRILIRPLDSCGMISDEVPKKRSTSTRYQGR